MIGAAIGAAVTTAGILLHLYARDRLLAAWRAADRRGWSAAVRPAARRRMPFRAFTWWLLMQRYEYEWRSRPPRWISDSPAARRWRRVYLLSPALIVIGMLAAITSLAAAPMP